MPLLALTATLACGQLGTDLDQLVALEVFLPDSGRIEVGDTLQPAARALNGRGDPVTGPIYWNSLDTGLVVLDSASGLSYGRAVGTARLQARAPGLRSNPENVFVLARLDSASAAGPIRDTVTLSAPDSVSGDLVVKAWAGTRGALGRPVVYVAAIYPAGATTVKFVPRDTVQTNAGGTAVAQLRFVTAPLPDSVVVTAAVRRPNGTHVPGSPVTFVVEFRP